MKRTTDPTFEPLTRRSFIARAGLFLLGLTPLAGACTGAWGEGEKRKAEMNAKVSRGSTPATKIPPIDLGPPAPTETATFAMG